MNVTTTRKADRQKRILEVIHEAEVATQSELKELLKSDGIEVDQGTLSRDIRELGLVRMATERGFKYALVEEYSPIVPAKSSRIVGRFVKSVAHSGHLVVVKTETGSAQTVSLAIDHLAWPEVIGTVAGDDTLLVIVREGVSAKKIEHKIQELREK
jgi:transcriptional regulator of arginine metabolism